MYSTLLQEWITVQATPSLSISITQSEEGWIDVSPFYDAMFWIDVIQVTGTVQLTLQGSPTRDESYFMAVAPSVTLAAAAAPITVRTVASASTVPLAKFLRWQLTSSSGSTWGATFRVRVALSRQPSFSPLSLAGCALWLRADLGVTVSSGKVQTWANQTGDSQKNLVQNTGANQPTYNASTPTYNGQATLGLSSASSTYMVSTNTAWSNPIGTTNTFIFVANNTSGGGAVDDLMDGATSTDGEPVSYTSSTPPSINFSGLVASNAPWSTPSIVLLESNGSSSTIYDNNLTTPLVTGTGGGGLHSMTFGSHSVFWGLSNYWDGLVAEVIAYTHILAQAEKYQLRNYLMGRYAQAPTG